ncbi:hypothetical protein NG769_04145 [Aliarcobacter cryaerophilus]|uniref:hypothetical protein n=1 Tax=Aliarcobacter cryaerophilus TaxID=28198 RepID=UPI003DA549E3
MKKIILGILLVFSSGFSYDRYKNSYDYKGDNRVSKKCGDTLFSFDISANMMDSLILPSILGYKADTAIDLESSYILFSSPYKDMKKEIIDISLACENIYEQMYALKRLNYLNEVQLVYSELKDKGLLK